MSRRTKFALASVLVVVVLATFALTRAPAELPAGFVPISSLPAYQDAALLERAWGLPSAKVYPRPLLSQRNPSACGPTSVANAIKTTPDLVAAHGAGCVSGFCFGGLTLEQLAEATRASAPTWKVDVVRPGSLEAFREELRALGDRRLIINFHRRPLFGRGGGHHSPIGGYLEAEDLVFVLDVNADYQPWLVSSARLFEAMNTVDSSSNEKRGLVRLSP
jgi:hypothetical protein